MQDRSGAGSELPLVPISIGELIDKISILEVKADRIGDARKRANVLTELEALMPARQRLNAPGMDELHERLRVVNRSLWDIEDAIRECERDGDFGPRFIGLARSVYRTNDERAKLKRSVNELTGSRLIEEKSYAAY